MQLQNDPITFQFKVVTYNKSIMILLRQSSSNMVNKKSHYSYDTYKYNKKEPQMLSGIGTCKINDFCGQLYDLFMQIQNMKQQSHI